VLDPAILMPAMMELHTDSEKFGWKLQEIVYLLEQIRDNTTPPADPKISSATSTGLANFLIVTSGAGKLYGFSGVNTNAAAQFILGFDLSTQSKVPANGSIPDFVTKASASDVFWVSWAPTWRQIERGFVICNSSTAGSLTIGANDCLFDAQWVPV
jgi:hypothetical protein